jgi:selenocysteine lyase/cysteine desulfurase
MDSLAAAYAERIGPGTGLVSVPLVAYQTGARPPVEEITALAHTSGARVFADAYQAAGVIDIDVDRLGVDFLVAGASKFLLGLAGIAFLYARSRPADEREPSLTGWFGRTDPMAFDPRTLDFPAGARRFETGTPAVPAVYAARAGLDAILGLDAARIERRVAGLIDIATARLATDGERVVGGPSGTGHLRARHGAHLAVAAADPAGLTARLAADGIAVSPRGGVVRLAVHYFTSEDDVVRACDAIARHRHRLDETDGPVTCAS